MPENHGEPFEGRELQFPLTCHFKIIAEEGRDVRTLLEIALAELEIHSPLERGNQSVQGSYVTYNLSVFVDSLESMNLIDGALRAVKGVRMVF